MRSSVIPDIFSLQAEQNSCLLLTTRHSPGKALTQSEGDTFFGVALAIAFERLAPTGGFVLSVLFRAKLDGNGALNLLKSEGNSELEDSELAAGDSEVVRPELELELEL